MHNSARQSAEKTQSFEEQSHSLYLWLESMNTMLGPSICRYIAIQCLNVSFFHFLVQKVRSNNIDLEAHATTIYADVKQKFCLPQTIPLSVNSVHVSPTSGPPIRTPKHLTWHPDPEAAVQDYRLMEDTANTAFSSISVGARNPTWRPRRSS
jgi:hypothetical protein